MTLKYFPISGRAEPIRLALHLGGVQFYDQRISGTDWEDKHKKQTPYGQLPVLVVDNQTIAQTKTILRYVGKLVKYDGQYLYPQDPVVAAKVDELLDVFDDMWVLLAPTFRIPDPGQKEQTRRALFVPGAEGAVMLDVLERQLAVSPNGYVVPEARGMTIADLMYFTFISQIRSGFIEGLGQSLLDPWAKIKQHKEKLANIQNIRMYYQDSQTSNPANVPYYQVFKPGE